MVMPLEQRRKIGEAVKKRILEWKQRDPSGYTQHQAHAGQLGGRASFKKIRVKGKKYLSQYQSDVGRLGGMTTAKIYPEVLQSNNLKLMEWRRNPTNELKMINAIKKANIGRVAWNKGIAMTPEAKYKNKIAHLKRYRRQSK